MKLASRCQGHTQISHNLSPILDSQKQYVGGKEASEEETFPIWLRSKLLPQVLSLYLDSTPLRQMRHAFRAIYFFLKNINPTSNNIIHFVRFQFRAMDKNLYGHWEQMVNKPSQKMFSPPCQTQGFWYEDLLAECGCIPLNEILQLQSLIPSAPLMKLWQRENVKMWGSHLWQDQNVR